jgi:hypothetical protein
MTQRNQLHCHEEILSVSRQLPRAFLFTNILRAPLVSGEVATGKIQSSDRATETFGGRALSLKAWLNCCARQ